MKKWTFVALLLVGATVLGGTVLREPIASAAQSVSATIVGPLDAKGNLSVHEQGTADVSVANPSVAVEQAGEPIAIHLFAGSGGYLVPQGKRLLIDYVNGDVNIGSDGTGPDIGLTLSGTSVSYGFLGQHEPFTVGIYEISEPVDITVGPGTEVNAVQGGNEPFTMVLSGHLVNGT
jgi:hypothetical protein